VRLLFDQNLSRRLVRMLEDEYPGSSHVVEVLRRHSGVIAEFGESDEEALLVLPSAL